MNCFKVVCLLHSAEQMHLFQSRNVGHSFRGGKFGTLKNGPGSFVVYFFVCFLFPILTRIFVMKMSFLRTSTLVGSKIHETSAAEVIYLTLSMVKTGKLVGKYLSCSSSVVLACTHFCNIYRIIL